MTSLIRDGPSFRTRTVRAWAGYTEVSENFNPEVGFLRRSSYRSVSTGVFRHFRPDIALFRELRPHVVYSGFWDLTGFKETEFLHFDSHFDFENGTLIEPAVNHTVEGLKAAFEISPGVIVAPGTYSHWELGWRWNTNLAAPLSYRGALTKGGFLSGNRNVIDTTINFRYGSRIITAFTWSYNDVDLAEGSFVANLGQFRISYNFTPLIYLQAFIQYNDDIDTWSSNVRLSWLTLEGRGCLWCSTTAKGSETTS